MDKFTYVSGALSRSHYKHYIDSTFGGSGTPSWFRLGSDVEDTSVNLNPDVSVKKNILDETYVEDNGYNPELDIPTYYANPGDAIYEKVKAIALGRLTGDDCKTTALLVTVDSTSSPYTAYTEDAIIKPQSYGGAGQGKLTIPFNIMFAGNRVEGTATFANKVPTFTAAT